MDKLNDVLEICINLDEKLEGGWNDDLIKKHLDLMGTKFNLKIPEFNQGLEWLNVSENLSFSNQLQGKLVILDFFTYCCINCMHILPDLENLEKRFSVTDGVVIVGVHSAKFENEKVADNILSAVLRYGIHHPVVNDGSAELWSELQIACWPTLVIVGPSGQFLYQLVGEGHRERLMKFVDVAVRYYKEKGELSDHPLPIQITALPDSALSFPGKVCVSDDGQTVVISDTGHHRIVITDSKGLVKTVIGGTEKGFKDGNYRDAKFSSPQGVALDGTHLYVADTENHAIRKIDLRTKTVLTIAGTGIHGDDKHGGNTGTEQLLSSPWDVCLWAPEDSGENSLLYIAMAGTHQIWVYALKEAAPLQNREKLPIGWCGVVAGSGLEENRNNSYPLKAGFAQPSGLSISRTKNTMYIADSESSSVRSMDLKSGAVKNLAGGDIDPRNLFGYGDQDGKGTSAKLQHPLGVSMVTDDGPLLVADSYNHKLKTIDISSRLSHTIMGTGKPGNNKGGNLTTQELNEPGGLCVDKRNKKVYIADTNNHQIKVLELDTESVYNFPILSLEDALNDYDELDNSESQPCPQVDVVITIAWAPGIHLNEEAPNSWSLYTEDETMQSSIHSSNVPLKGKLTQDTKQTLTSIPESSLTLMEEFSLCLKLNLFICEDSGICRMENKVLKQTLTKGSNVIEIVFGLHVT